MSAEVANVYAITAWAGWAHFVFAFRGQGAALLRLTDPERVRRLALYAAAVVLAIALLVPLRLSLGAGVFGAMVWIYFIDHFIKAERTFSGTLNPKESWIRRWLSSYQGLISFTWLTIVLMNVFRVNAYPWTVWVISLGLAAVVLGLGGWQSLSSGAARGPLLALFFIGEALVWGAFSRYGGAMFLTGVYVFHIAAGSFLHYFGSYFFAGTKAGPSDKRSLSIWVVLVNLTVILLGLGATTFDFLKWLNPVFGIEWFTLWVALHLVSSDLFPAIKRLKRA